MSDTHRYAHKTGQNLIAEKNSVFRRTYILNSHKYAHSQNWTHTIRRKKSVFRRYIYFKQS